MKNKKIKSNRFFELVDQINEDLARKEFKDESSKIREWLEKMLNIYKNFHVDPHEIPPFPKKIKKKR